MNLVLVFVFFMTLFVSGVRDSVVWERIGEEGLNLKKYWNNIRDS